MLTTRGALAGIKVVECAQFVAGPYCTRLLADLGAEIIKIEEPGIGDESRRKGPFLNDVPHPEKSGLFLYLNINKLGITLNLSLKTGQKLFRELIQGADILVEDEPPGFMKQLGLDYEVLKGLNPRLIHTSITPFGQTGPYKDYKAYYLNSYHSGGEGYTTPGGTDLPDQPPLKVGKFVGEYLSGIGAGVAILAALYWRESSGLGQYIDISKQEVLAGINAAELVRYPNDGAISTRKTRGYLSAGVFRCQDGYVELAFQQEKTWHIFVEMMGHPQWSKDDKFKDFSSREKNAAELKQHIAEFLKEYKREEIYQIAQEKRCTLGPYLTLNEVVNNQQMKWRGFFVDIGRQEVGRLSYPSGPYKFSETPWKCHRPAPLLGQHNEEVYCQRLGYSKDELVRLGEAGVV